MSFINNSDKNIINKSTETIDTDIFFQTESNNQNESDAPVNVISGTLESQKPVEAIDIDKMLNEINNINKPILEKQDEEAKVEEQLSKEKYENEIKKRQQQLLEEKVKKEEEERERIKKEEEEELFRIEEEKKNKKKVKEQKNKEPNVISSDIKDKVSNISEKINNINIDKNKIKKNIEDTKENIGIINQNIKENTAQKTEDIINDIEENKNEEIKNTEKKQDKSKKEKIKKVKEEKERKPLFQTKDIVKNIKDFLPTKSLQESVKKNNKADNINISDDIDWKEKATHDELTNLKNKTAFEEDIKIFNNEGCILFADVNNLKYVNDKIGHFAGDTLLIEISKVLNKNFRNVYRIGGDEFIILTEEKENSVIKKIDNINKNLEQITKRDKTGIIYSVAIGYAYGDGIKTIDDIKNEADSNMYDIKQKYKSNHPELNIRSENIDNNDWKSLALIDQNTKLYNKLALSYEKITKNTIVNLIRIIDFLELKREQSEEQLKILADIIRTSSNNNNKVFYIDNGSFILLLNKKEIDDILTKANALSIPIEYNSVTGIEDTIDEIIDILESKLGNKSKKEDKELTYNEKLSIVQRKMKEDIKNNHEAISDEYLDEILMQIQRKAQDIEIVLIASKDFNTLFIFFDVFEFLDCVYESQDNLDFSYIYAAHSKGAVYYGADEYDKEITTLFQGIADGLKKATINSTKDISKIPGINIFENIYIN